MGVIPQDYVKAAEYYRRSAELGNVGAMSDYGNMLAAGLGVKKELDKALAWHEKAAELGHAGGCYNAAQSYCNGEGTPQHDDPVRFRQQVA